MTKSGKPTGRKSGLNMINAGGTRGLSVRVKTAKNRKIASTLWLERQLNDPYVAAARREGYRSRAAYKLLQIDEHYHLFKPGMTVIDLGAAPGGWAQVAAKLVKAGTGSNSERRVSGQGGHVIGIDILEMEPLPGVNLLHLDFMDATAPDLLKAQLDGRRADAVLSDMAAPATGHRQTDHIRIMALCEVAALFAAEVLTPGGFFLAKVLQGGTERALLQALKRDYQSVRHVKPPASRQDSAEAYVLATGFRGTQPA